MIKIKKKSFFYSRRWFILPAVRTSRTSAGVYRLLGALLERLEGGIYKEQRQEKLKKISITGNRRYA